MSPQAFMGIPAGKFFRRGDGFGELKSDGEFPVAIPTRSLGPGGSREAKLRMFSSLLARVDLKPTSLRLRARKMTPLVGWCPGPASH
jgi:hypothetical protein